MIVTQVRPAGLQLQNLVLEMPIKDFLKDLIISLKSCALMPYQLELLFTMNGRSTVIHGMLKAVRRSISPDHDDHLVLTFAQRPSVVRS